VEDRASSLVVATFLLLFLVVGLPLNLLVIATIVKQRLYTQPTIILLLNLVITDLVLLVFHLPLVMIVGFHGEYLFGGADNTRCVVCDKTGFVSLLFSLNSTFTISIMSVDRFLFIYKSLHYSRYVTKWRTVVAIVIAWFIAAVMSALSLSGFGNITYSSQSASCGLDLSLTESFYPILVLVISGVAIIPVVVCNIWVCCIVQRNIRAIYKVRRSENSDATTFEFNRSVKKSRQKKEAHLFKVFGALLSSYAVTWLPTVILVLVSFSQASVPTSFVAVAQVFFLFQTVLHPIIETILIKDVQKPLKAIVFCCCITVKAKVVDANNSEKVKDSAFNTAQDSHST
jgi:hypothetical protein